MRARLGRSWLLVLVVLAIVAWPAHAQDVPPDSSGQPTDTTLPDDTMQPGDTTGAPTDTAATPTDTPAPPNTGTVQPPALSAQSAPTCSAAQTQAATSAIPGRPLRPTPEPGASQTAVQVFCKPFSGEYSTADFFDHDLPFEFTDNNGYQLTWWGLKVWPTVDGHNAYDWSMPEGTPILAVAPGTVVFADATPPFACPILGGRQTVGNVVTIEHQVKIQGETMRVRSGYYHLSRVDIQAGQTVNAGDQVGLSGNTGCSGGPHLHFQTNVFVRGRFIPIDPYGWEGQTPDPWAQDWRGTDSFWLWQDGQAPAISYLDRTLVPNTPAGTAPVAITYVRWLAARDDQNPNNEFVELSLDPRYAPSGMYDLSRNTLRNNQGDTLTFPDGFRIHQGTTVRVYVGAGQNTATELYWGRSIGVFNPMGDCVRLQGPTWGGYRIATVRGSCD